MADEIFQFLQHLTDGCNQNYFPKLSRYYHHLMFTIEDWPEKKYFYRYLYRLRFLVFFYNLMPDNWYILEKLYICSRSVQKDFCRYLLAVCRLDFSIKVFGNGKVLIKRLSRLFTSCHISTVSADEFFKFCS